MATAVITQKPPPIDRLPEVQSKAWVRDEPPPKRGPLFDARGVLVGFLLHQMETAGLAQRGSMQCGEASRCEGEALVLEAGVKKLALSVNGNPPQFTVGTYGAKARLVTSDGRALWQEECELSIAPKQPQPGGEHAAQLQGLLDAASVICADRLYQALERQLLESKS